MGACTCVSSYNTAWPAVQMATHFQQCVGSLVLSSQPTINPTYYHPNCLLTPPATPPTSIPFSEQARYPQTVPHHHGGDTLQQFVQRLLQQGAVTRSAFVVSMIYQARATKALGTESKHACKHCLSLGCLVLANKFVQDIPSGNSLWGMWADMPARAVTEVELWLLKLLKYGLHVGQNEFDEWKGRYLDNLRSKLERPGVVATFSSPSPVRQLAHIPAVVAVKNDDGMKGVKRGWEPEFVSANVNARIARPRYN